MSAIRTALTACAAVGLGAALSIGVAGCGSSSSVSEGGATTPAEKIVVSQAWIKTTDNSTSKDMTGLFANLKNTTDKDLTIVSGTCDVAGMIEVHEMVMKDGKMVMQRKEGGKVIPAGQTEVLKPGSDHIMLMKLKKELKPGDEATVTLKLSDGSELKITAPVKTFTDGNSQYVGTGTASPSGSMSMPMSPSMTMAPSMTMSSSMPMGGKTS